MLILSVFMRNTFVMLLVFYVQVSFGQQTLDVDFKTASAILHIDLDSTTVSGIIGYTFDVKNDIDTLKIDARKMHISNVILNKKPVDFEYNNSQIYIVNQLKPSVDNTLLISYSTQPKQTLYFFKKEDHFNVWSQGQGKYTSHWLPSFDDVNEKLIFNFVITTDSNYELISNGNLTSKIPGKDGKTDYFYKMKSPMSSYLVALAIGKYLKKTETSTSGIPLEFYYYPEDSLKFESTYRYSKQMFDFLESEIGVKYPWQNYKQVPVHDFLYAGMENTTLTIFSDRYVVDEREFLDRNYVNVNAHELAHQWFGNLVTAKSGKHHWLQEGFATYYALLAEREIFGNDYFYWQLYQYAKQLKIQQEGELATPLLDGKASSLTFYQKGAVVLHLLKSKIGDTAFKQAVANYLNKHAFNSADSDDFIKEVEIVISDDLEEFFNKWLNQNSFDYSEVLEVLKLQSTFITDFELIDCEVIKSKCNDYLSMPLHPKIKAKLIAQMPELINPEHFKDAHEVRLSIVTRLNTISDELKPYFESLLDDESYIIIEQALYKLWMNFPEDRAKYLNKTKNLKGNNNHNIRLLWLVLSLNTVNYDVEYQQKYLDELVSFSSDQYHFETREAAFGYLNAINFWNEKALNNLKTANNHPNWRFRTTVRDLIENLKTKEAFKPYLEE
jgi:aminopeptidase N